MHQAVEHFADRHFSYLKPSSAKRYAVSIENLIDNIKDLPLGKIGSAELSMFERRRLADGVSTATIRRDLACLSSIFSRAEEWEWVDRNPVKPFLRGRAKAGLTEGEERTRYLSHAEESAIIQDAPQRAARAISIAVDTGMRKEEQFSLLRTDVDLAGNWIKLRPEMTKTGKGRWIPLWPRARLIVEELLAESNSPFLFSTHQGERYSPNSPTMYEALQKGARRAGIVDHVQWHDLRRTCGCRLLQDHRWPIEDVSHMLGHADIRITQKRYAFVKIGDLQRRVRRSETLSPLVSPLSLRALRAMRERNELSA